MTPPDAGLRERIIDALRAPCSWRTVYLGHAIETAEVESVTIERMADAVLALPAPGGRRFPVLYGYGRPANGPRSVPWKWVERYGAQAERNHGQTLRGGLDPLELWWVVHGRRYGDEGIKHEQAVAWLSSEPWAPVGALTEEERAELAKISNRYQAGRGIAGYYCSDVQWLLALVARLSGGRA